MSQTLGTLVIALQAQTESFARGMANAKAISLTTSEGIVASLKTVETQFGKLKFGSVGEFKRSAEIMVASLAGIGIAATAAAVTFAKSTADQALQLNKLSQTYGISIEALTGLRVASQMTGVSMESMARGLGFLDKAAVKAVQGSKEQTLAFKQLGLSAKDLTDGKGGMKEQLPLLLMVADRFSKLKDGVLKVYEAKTLMGRGGPEEIAMMNAGAAAIQGWIDKAKAMGLVMTAEDIAAALKFHETIELLDLKMDAMKLQIGMGLMPALNALSNAFLKADATGNTAAKSLGEGVGEALKVVALTLNECVAGFKELNAVMAEAGRQGPTLGATLRTAIEGPLGGLDLLLQSAKDSSDKVDKIEAERQRIADLIDPAKRRHYPGEAILQPSGNSRGFLQENIQWAGAAGGINAPVIPMAGSSKAAAEQMQQMESQLKSMKADWGMTLSDEAWFWDQMLVPASKYADNLRKVTDQINDILGRMRQQTRELTEKTFGSPEQQKIYSNVGIQPPMATYGEAGQMFDEAEHSEQQKELNTLEANGARFVADWNKRAEERKSILDSLLTPMGQLAEYQERINLDYHNGTIDGETWARAMADATDNIKGMYDPTVRIEKEIKNLNEMMADPKTALSTANYTQRLKELQAQTRMAQTVTAPKSGFGGIGQGMGAGAAQAATEWKGLSASMAQETAQVASQMSNSMSKAFTDMIMGTKTVGQAFAEMGVSMLQAVVSAITQMIAQWIVYGVIMKALSAIGIEDPRQKAADQIASNATIALSDAGLAAANTFALMSAVSPPPGPEIAAVIAYSVGLGLAGLTSMATGGLLPRDMVIQAHSGEAVLPQKLTSYLMDSASHGQQSAVVGERGHTFNMPITINGATDAEEVTRKVVAHVQRVFRTGGVMR